MSNVVRGLIAVAGNFDTGKSSFALGMPGVSPKDIIIFNSDVRDANVLDSIGVTHINLVNIAEKNKKELQFHDEVMKLIDGIKVGQYKLIIFDTWASFADTFNAYVKKNKSKFSTEWMGTPEIVGGKTWKQTRRHEGFIINKLLMKAETVILTAHLKNHYEVGHKTNLLVPAFSPAVTRAATLKIWLRKNPNSPVPIALVEKRMNTRAYNEDLDRIETVSVLPQKMVPDKKHTSLWDYIDYYIREPISLREPTENERLTEQELLDMAGVLSDDDMRTLLSMIENKPFSDEETETLGDEAKKMAIDGYTQMQIAEELELTLPEVKQLLT